MKMFNIRSHKQSANNCQGDVKQAGRDINEGSKATDYYFDNEDLTEWYELKSKGEEASPRGLALKDTLEKRGYHL
jgi:hypothetical protein